IAIGFASIDSSAQPRSRFFLRAPDALPGTLPEMRETSYWIDKMDSPDEVVLTTEQIEEKNAAYEKRLREILDSESPKSEQIGRELRKAGLFAIYPDLSTKTPTEISDIVKEIVDQQLNSVRRGPSGNILGIENSEGEMVGIRNELAFDQIKDQITIQPGITVKTGLLKIIPSLRYEYVGYMSSSRDWDMWNLDIVPIGSKVQILHTSASGGHVFVLSDRGYGWLKSEEVALCSEKEAGNFIDTEDFWICTDDMTPFYSDESCTYTSGWMRMGDKLPATKNSKIIMVPTRQANGGLEIQEAWLKTTSDVSKGYLPYTRKNVVIQAFKMLDNMYDWTGGFYGRNHMTVLRDLYSSFGFELPANGGMTLLSVYSPREDMITPDAGKEKQYEAILSHEPLLTIDVCSSGHSLIVLGEYNGEPITFDTHGYKYNDDEGNERIVRRQVVGTLEMPDYFLEQDISFIELK
ncbi:MAG TPA: hypothetical protein VEP89_09465, partial [Draconibacterium sp.]|nr:hypothetical protein [Draconibacterium sp.]